MTDASEDIRLALPRPPRPKSRLRMRPEEQLASRDEYLRSILDALPQAVYVTDTAGRITYFNEAAAAFWGARPELGKDVWCGSWKLYRTDGTTLPHDECPMAVAIKEKRVVRGEEAVVERPDGSRVRFRPYPTPLFNAAGVFIGAVNMLVDVSDRRRADEYETLLASIVENSDDAIVSKDLNGIVSSWNAGAQRLFGYEPEEMIGRSILTLIPKDRRDEETAILARIRNNERIDHYETVRQRKDGSLVEVSLTVSPIRDADGRIVGAAKIARDITLRKRAQEQQALLLSEMKHRIKNSLATVQAIATQTLRSASKEDRTAFGERLRALAQAHDLLTLESWNRASLREIVMGAVGPFSEIGRERFWVEGADNVWLNANRSVIVAMMLHELATNAVKYGALSAAGGHVRVIWRTPRDRADRVTLVWQEIGGPPVEPPQRKGFGSVLIERALGDLGSATFDYRRDGLVCTLEMAL